MEVILDNENSQFSKYVVVTDDNANNFQVFAGNIGEEQRLAIQINVSPAGYGSVHYREGSNTPVGSKLLSEGDHIYL